MKPACHGCCALPVARSAGGQRGWREDGHSTPTLGALLGIVLRSPQTDGSGRLVDSHLEPGIRTQRVTIRPPKATRPSASGA